MLDIVALRSGTGLVRRLEMNETESEAPKDSHSRGRG